jgi:hypothetical protein
LSTLSWFSAHAVVRLPTSLDRVAGSHAPETGVAGAACGVAGGVARGRVDTLAGGCFALLPSGCVTRAVRRAAVDTLSQHWASLFCVPLFDALL